MNVWKAVAFWIVALIALTLLFMTPLAHSLSTEILVGGLVAAAIVFVVLNYSKRTHS